MHTSKPVSLKARPVRVHPRSRPRHGLDTLLTTAGVVGLVLAGCGAVTPAGTPSTSAPRTATRSQAGPSEQPAASRVGDPTFELSFSAETAGVGTPGVAKIELRSKAPFKCNDKYPYKFKPAPTPGLSHPSDVIRGDAARISHDRVIMSVPFTANSAGTHTLRGTFSFSVCTDDQCRIEKRDLSLEIEAH